MPTYDYACKSCDYHSEQIRKIAERHEPTNEPCPDCGESTVYICVGSPVIGYNNVGTKRTDDDFNSRLKQLRDRVPAEYRGNLEKNIR